MTVVALFAGAWLFIWFGFGSWQGVQREVLGRREYWVTPEEVAITPLPAWIRADVRGEVLRDAGLDGELSLMDPGLAERVARAFAQHPWVAGVGRVIKRYPAGLRVELTYRRPVCMVETAPGTLQPVDGDGVLLPIADFSPIEARRYPRLVATGSVPRGPSGTGWGDPRVVGGARIAALLEPLWQSFRLDRIVPGATDSAGGPGGIQYVIYTRGGTRILWGSPPATAVPGEASAADKVARLREYFRQNGTLESPRQLDLRPKPFRSRTASRGPVSPAAGAPR